MKKLFATLVVAAALGGASPALADSNEAGNGGGASRQCTGPQDARPANCQSQGGPGDQP